MTHAELEDRLDDIVSMGERRAKAHIKALYLDLIGDDDDGEKVQAPCPDSIVGCSVLHTEVRLTDSSRHRNELRHELRSQVGDV